MTDAQIKEQYSLHLIKMMASLEGYVIGTTNLDRGIDFQIRKVEHFIYPLSRQRYFLSGKGVDVQLKTTSNFQLAENGKFVKYDLEVKNLNDLEQRRQIREEYSGGILPLLLLVHCIPANKEDLMVVHQNEISLKGAFYWFYPSEPLKFSSRKSSERIFIPTENQVDLGFFDQMIEKFYQKGSE